MPREIPRGMKFWGKQDDLYSPDEITKRYNDGFAGAWRDRAEDEKLQTLIHSQGGNFDGDSVCHTYGLSESGKGKLSLSFLPALTLWPGCMPGPAQTRGDCVSHGQKNAGLITIAAEIVAGTPDEVTGDIEGAPEVPTTGIAQGVFSTEAIYWWRRHGGDGWSCSSSARVVINESGMWVRKLYPDFGVDLTSYSGRTAGKWGARTPPGAIKEFGLQHNIRTATEAKTDEVRRDLIANYYGINHCGSQGLSSRRDENGLTRRSGSWAHAMSYIGVDDRPWAHQKYGCMILLNLNSWGRSWVSGPRDIHDSSGMVPNSLRQEWIKKGIVNSSTGNIMIPEGSSWVKASDMRGRYNVAMSSAKGWPPTKLKYFESAFG